MMKCLYVVLLCALLFLSSLSEAKQLQCDVPAPAAILINAETGAILYEKNAHQLQFPASTTKIATALYALEKKGSFLQSPVVASAEALGAVSTQIRRSSGAHPSYRLEFGGTHIGLKVGEILPLRDLLYGLMLSSGNDAANVIAEYVSGSVPHFMEEMNTFLRASGCLHTHFTNPHGLPDPSHVTTAYDLAQMARVGMKNVFFRQVVKTVSCPRPATNKQPESVLVQTNGLLKSGPYYYPYAIGVKTGYTVSAGQALVAAAEKEGRNLIAVALNCDDKASRYKAAVALFEAGFNEKKVQRKLFAKEYHHFTKEVKGAKSPVEAILQNDVYVEYYPSEEADFQAAIKWDAIHLPTIAGEKVGQLQIKDVHGVFYNSFPIYAAKDIQKTFIQVVVDVADSTQNVLRHHKQLIGLGFGCILLGSIFYRQHRKKKAHGKNWGVGPKRDS